MLIKKGKKSLVSSFRYSKMIALKDNIQPVIILATKIQAVSKVTKLKRKLANNQTPV